MTINDRVIDIIKEHQPINAQEISILLGNEAQLSSVRYAISHHRKHGKIVVVAREQAPNSKGHYIAIYAMHGSKISPPATVRNKVIETSDGLSVTIYNFRDHKIALLKRLLKTTHHDQDRDLILGILADYGCKYDGK